MKFGKRLHRAAASFTDPAYARNLLDYKALKKLIKKLAASARPRFHHHLTPSNNNPSIANTSPSLSSTVSSPASPPRCLQTARAASVSAITQLNDDLSNQLSSLSTSITANAANAGRSPSPSALPASASLPSFSSGISALTISIPSSQPHTSLSHLQSPDSSLSTPSPSPSPTSPLTFPASASSSSSPPSEDYSHLAREFILALEAQLLKINCFYSHMVSSLGADVLQLRSAVDSEGERCDLSSLSDLCESMSQLRKFIVLNYLGVIKIVKKHDKNAPHPVADRMIPFLYAQPFYHSLQVAQLYTEVDSMSRRGRKQLSRDEFRCPLCQELLDCPVVLSCSHRFCWKCLSSAACSSAVHDACPVCRKPQLLDPSNYIVDDLLLRFIKENFPKKPTAAARIASSPALAMLSSSDSSGSTQSASSSSASSLSSSSSSQPQTAVVNEPEDDHGEQNGHSHAVDGDGLTLPALSNGSLGSPASAMITSSSSSLSASLSPSFLSPVAQLPFSSPPMLPLAPLPHSEAALSHSQLMRFSPSVSSQPPPDSRATFSPPFFFQPSQRQAQLEQLQARNEQQQHSMEHDMQHHQHQHQQLHQHPHQQPQRHQQQLQPEQHYHHSLQLPVSSPAFHAFSNGNPLLSPSFVPSPAPLELEHLSSSHSPPTHHRLSVRPWQSQEGMGDKFLLPWLPEDAEDEDVCADVQVDPVNLGYRWPHSFPEQLDADFGDDGRVDRETMDSLGATRGGPASDGRDDYAMQSDDIQGQDGSPLSSSSSPASGSESFTSSSTIPLLSLTSINHLLMPDTQQLEHQELQRSRRRLDQSKSVDPDDSKQQHQQHQSPQQHQQQQQEERRHDEQHPADAQMFGLEPQRMDRLPSAEYVVPLYSPPLPASAERFQPPPTPSRVSSSHSQTKSSRSSSPSPPRPLLPAPQCSGSTAGDDLVQSQMEQLHANLAQAVNALVERHAASAHKQQQQQSATELSAGNSRDDSSAFAMPARPPGSHHGLHGRSGSFQGETVASFAFESQQESSLPASVFSHLAQSLQAQHDAQAARFTASGADFHFQLPQLLSGSAVGMDVHSGPFAPVSRRGDGGGSEGSRVMSASSSPGKPKPAVLSSASNAVAASSAASGAQQPQPFLPSHSRSLLHHKHPAAISTSSLYSQSAPSSPLQQLGHNGAVGLASSLPDKSRNSNPLHVAANPAASPLSNPHGSRVSSPSSASTASSLSSPTSYAPQARPLTSNGSNVTALGLHSPGSGHSLAQQLMHQQLQQQLQQQQREQQREQQRTRMTRASSFSTTSSSLPHGEQQSSSGQQQQAAAESWSPGKTEPSSLLQSLQHRQLQQSFDSHHLPLNVQIPGSSASSSSSSAPFPLRLPHLSPSLTPHAQQNPNGTTTLWIPIQMSNVQANAITGQDGGRGGAAAAAGTPGSAGAAAGQRGQDGSIGDGGSVASGNGEDNEKPELANPICFPGLSPTLLTSAPPAAGLSSLNLSASSSPQASGSSSPTSAANFAATLAQAMSGASSPSASSRGSPSFPGGRRQPKFLCSHPGCSDGFNTRFSLKRHLKIHSGEKPFPCHQCPKSFAEKSTLVRHLRIHTGEKPYCCTWAGCSRTFSDRTNVKRHEQQHEQQKDLPPDQQTAMMSEQMEREIIRRREMDLDQQRSREQLQQHAPHQHPAGSHGDGDSSGVQQLMDGLSSLHDGRGGGDVAMSGSLPSLAGHDFFLIKQEKANDGLEEKMDAQMQG